MRKIIAIILAVAVVFSVCGCVGSVQTFSETQEQTDLREALETSL